MIQFRLRFCRRHGFPVAAAVAAAGLAAGCVHAQPRPAAPTASPEAEPARPNFIFIVGDDMRFDAMGCAGHPFAKTPGLDRMAREGVRFANAFVTTSLCGPSRVSFLTGTYARVHGVRGNDAGRVDPALRSFPAILKDNGYRIAHFGKWHMPAVGIPNQGYDVWVSFAGQGVYVDPELNVDGLPVKTRGYITDLLTDRVEEFLRRPHDRPFYLTLAHKAVHEPFTPAERHRGLYADLQLPAPAGADPDAWNPRDPQILDWFRTLAALDESVSRILDVLVELGLDRNTLVVFSSDNGFLHLEHGLRDKRLAFEASMRIPLLAWGGPLASPGRTITLDALNIDVAPTILDLATVPVPPAIQGRSLRPLLEGRTVPWREDFFYEYFHERAAPHVPTLFAVRSPRWKYVEVSAYPGMNQLYDLKADPSELHNLVRDPSAAKPLRRMQARLRALMNELSPRAGRTSRGRG